MATVSTTATVAAVGSTVAYTIIIAIATAATVTAVADAATGTTDTTTTGSHHAGWPTLGSVTLWGPARSASGSNYAPHTRSSTAGLGVVEPDAWRRLPKSHAPSGRAPCTMPLCWHCLPGVVEWVPSPTSKATRTVTAAVGAAGTIVAIVVALTNSIITAVATTSAASSAVPPATPSVTLSALLSVMSTATLSALPSATSCQLHRGPCRQRCRSCRRRHSARGGGCAGVD